MILFTGDLFLGNSKIQIDNEILSLINNSNYIVSNFESVWKDDTLPKREDKGSILQFERNSLDNYLSQVKSKLIFTLGNNHIHDLGERGLQQTREFLKNYKNIILFGAGYYSEIIKPYIIESNKKKIAVLCLSTDEPEVMSKLATDKFQGVLDYNDIRISEVIKNIKKTVDYFVIIPHWGREYIDYPAVQIRNKAYSWIDAGADIVIGHHPHVIQGKEQYKGKWIYYSLGNYIFPEFYTKNGLKQSWKPENNQSILLEINFLDNISIKETGLEFDIKSNTLLNNAKSLKIFYNKSKLLDRSLITIKRYFGIWERNYLEKISNQYDESNNIINRYLPKHREYSRLGYFFIRLLKKIKGK